MVFTFVRKPGVAWHNNLAENHVRQGVLYRKLSGGRRSWHGAEVLERLMSVYRTCRIQSAEVCRSSARRAAREGLPGLRCPVRLTTKLNAYVSGRISGGSWTGDGKRSSRWTTGASMPPASPGQGDNRRGGANGERRLAGAVSASPQQHN